MGLVLSVSACSSSSVRPAPNADGAGVPRAVDCNGNCTFTARYTVGTDGFFAAGLDQAAFSPPQAYLHSAFVFADDGSSTRQTLTCAPPIPSCGDGGSGSACDIAQDLDDPVVQAALAQATPPFFGPDTRGIDGNAFSFRRDDGHGFEVGLGSSCASASNCVPVPAAIARLKEDIQKLDTALITTPECTALAVGLRTAGAE